MQRLLEELHDVAGPSVPDLPARAAWGMMQAQAPMSRDHARRARAHPPLIPGDAGWAAVRDYRDDERLAVYDWMVSDGPEAQLLADAAALWITAAICGDRYERRRGSAPGLRLRPTAPPLRFRILCSRLLPLRLPILDSWRSGHYRRVTAEGEYRGILLRTQIYVLKEAGLY